jgi:hypothetical protein
LHRFRVCSATQVSPVVGLEMKKMLASIGQYRKSEIVPQQFSWG